ncbi:MAG: MFS transporter, partial [Salinirussus sp.]
LGRTTVLVVAILGFGATGMSISLISIFPVALALRFLQGACAAGMNPVVITLIGDLYTGDREATGQGLRFAASGASGTVLPLIAGAIVALGWQYPFLLYGLAVPIALAVVKMLDEPAPTNSDDGGGSFTYIRRLAGLFRYPRVAAMVVARGLPSTVWFGFLTFNSIVVIRLLDSSPAVAGLMTSLGSLAFALPATQAGRITERFESRFSPLVAANALLAIGLSMFALAPSLPWAVVGVLLLGIGEGVTMSIYRSIIASLPPQALRGGLVSLAESFGWITSTAAPVAIGATIAAGSTALGFRTAVAVALVGTGLIAGLGGIVCMIVVRASGPVRVG